MTVVVERVVELNGEQKMDRLVLENGAVINQGQKRMVVRDEAGKIVFSAPNGLVASIRLMEDGWFPIEEQIQFDTGEADIAVTPVETRRREVRESLAQLYERWEEALDRSDGARRVLEERLRQFDEGYDEEHDDQHTAGDLAVHAAALLVAGTDARIEDELYRVGYNPDSGTRRDSWGLVEKYERDRLSQVVVAGALAAAEADRLLRKEAEEEQR